MSIDEKNAKTDCTENNLDEYTDGNNIVGCPQEQVVSHLSSRSYKFESQRHSNYFGHHCGNSHGE